MNKPLWAYPKRKSAYGARWSDRFRSLKNKPCWPSRPYKNSLRRSMAAMLYFSSRSSIAWDLPEISEEKATQDEAKPEVILIIIIFQEDLCCVENCQHCVLWWLVWLNTLVKVMSKNCPFAMLVGDFHCQMMDLWLCCCLDHQPYF